MPAAQARRPPISRHSQNNLFSISYGGIPMSSITSFARHRRFLCDRAVSQANSRLGRDERARQCFFELLQQARLRAPRLFDAPATQICHPGIEALFHLARVHQQHVRRVSTWSGSDRSWRASIASLSLDHIVTSLQGRWLSIFGSSSIRFGLPGPAPP